MAYRRKAAPRRNARSRGYPTRKRVGSSASRSSARRRTVGRSGGRSRSTQQTIRLVIQQPSVVQTPALALGPAPAPRKSTL